MFPYLVGAIIVIGLPTLYIAVRFREYRKFLAGAFFVSSGMQFYFYLAKIPIPLMWTNAVQSPHRARHDPLCALPCLFVFRVVLPQTTRRLDRLRTSIGEAANTPMLRAARGRLKENMNSAGDPSPMSRTSAILYGSRICFYRSAGAAGCQRKCLEVRPIPGLKQLQGSRLL